MLANERYGTELHGDWRRNGQLSNCATMSKPNAAILLDIKGPEPRRNWKAVTMFPAAVFTYH